MPLKPEYTEIALTLLSLGMLISYHLQLYRQVRNNPVGKVGVIYRQVLRQAEIPRSPPRFGCYTWLQRC